MGSQGAEIVAACRKAGHEEGLGHFPGACAACIDGALAMLNLALVEYRDLLSQREGEIMALREALHLIEFGYLVRDEEGDDSVYEVCPRCAVSRRAGHGSDCEISEALSSTAPVAARIREEIRQEERERCAAVARRGTEGCPWCSEPLSEHEADAIAGCIAAAILKEP